MDSERKKLEIDVRKTFKLNCWCAAAFFVIAFLFTGCILIFKYNGILTTEAKSILAEVSILGMMLGSYYACRIKTKFLLFYIAAMVLVGLWWGSYEVILILPAVCCFGFTLTKMIRIYWFMRKYINKPFHK